MRPEILHVCLLVGQCSIRQHNNRNTPITVAWQQAHTKWPTELILYNTLHIRSRWPVIIPALLKHRADSFVYLSLTHLSSSSMIISGFAFVRIVKMTVTKVVAHLLINRKLYRSEWVDAADAASISPCSHRCSAFCARFALSQWYSLHRWHVSWT